MISDAVAGADGPSDRPGIAAAEVQYQTVAAELADKLDRTVEGWITRVVSERLGQPAVSDELAAQIAEVARATHDDVVPHIRALLTADVDQQRAGPLAVLRGCVGPANELLAEAGVAPPKRDPVTKSMFPADPYELGPANFDEVDPSLHDIGLVWGAAKAHVVILRHRS